MYAKWTKYTLTSLLRLESINFTESISFSPKGLLWIFEFSYNNSSSFLPKGKGKIQDSNPQEQALTAELITRVAIIITGQKQRGVFFRWRAADAGEIFFATAPLKNARFLCTSHGRLGKEGNSGLGFAPALNYYYAWVCVKLLRWRV